MVRNYETAKDLLEIEPTTLPNTYLKYYLMADETVEHANPNYTRANEIMDRREKDTFEECERIIKMAQQEIHGLMQVNILNLLLN